MLVKEKVDAAVFNHLKKQDYNLAVVYTVYVEVFNGECSARALHTRLRNEGFKWVPTSFEYFRDNWLRRVRSAMRRVEKNRYNGKPPTAN